jgi:hypothetical protein
LDLWRESDVLLLLERRASTLVGWRGVQHHYTARPTGSIGSTPWHNYEADPLSFQLPGLLICLLLLTELNIFVKMRSQVCIRKLARAAVIVIFLASTQGPRVFCWQLIA